MQRRERGGVVNEDAMDRGVCENEADIWRDIARRKDELRAETSQYIEPWSRLNGDALTMERFVSNPCKDRVQVE